MVYIELAESFGSIKSPCSTGCTATDLTNYLPGDNHDQNSAKHFFKFDVCLKQSYQGFFYSAMVKGGAGR